MQLYNVHVIHRNKSRNKGRTFKQENKCADDVKENANVLKKRKRSK